MKWISLIFATASMAAIGWLVWHLTALQERRAAERERASGDGTSDDTAPSSQDGSSADGPRDQANARFDRSDSTRG